MGTLHFSGKREKGISVHRKQSLKTLSEKEKKKNRKRTEKERKRTEKEHNNKQEEYHDWILIGSSRKSQKELKISVQIIFGINFQA